MKTAPTLENADEMPVAAEKPGVDSPREVTPADETSAEPPAADESADQEAAPAALETEERQTEVEAAQKVAETDPVAESNSEDSQKPKEQPFEEKPQTESKSLSNKVLWPLVVLGLLLIIAGIYSAIFSTRALPNVQMAGQPVSGKSERDLAALAKVQAAAVKLTFKTGGASENVTPANAGIAFDTAATAKQAVNAKKQSLLDRLQFWHTENVPLIYQVNRTAFDAYMQKHLIKGWILPVEAKLAFNTETKQYDVMPATPGQGIHMHQVTEGLDKAAAHPGAVTIAITPVPTNATIGRAAAETAQKKANTLLVSDIQMFYGGRRVFYFEPSEIDTLLDIIPKTEQKTLEISVNPDRVQEFVDNNVTSTIARAARDQISLVNPNTGEKLVIQEGVRGQKLVGNEKLAASIVTALKSGKAFHTDIEVEEGGYSEKTFNGVNRWAEVNLTRQEAYMHLDDQVIQTFRISSGRAATPSDPGEWAVSRKIPLHTMRGTINGESYVVPNVPWVVFFNPDAEAFHGAYWHNNFGTPMSHGCINMTIPDAKMMYNFAYIGMRVSVHY